MCFCGMSEHCGYQIETDMEQHDKAIYEQGIDEFSERLKEKLKYQCESGEFYLPNIVLYKILKIIDKVTEEHKGGWIPCSSGNFPDKEVLVCKEDGTIDFDIFDFMYNDWKFNSNHHKNKVIAWQPLPEPYKEETT